MKQKIFRSGHSLAVVVPSNFVKEIAVKAGDDVQVITDPGKGKVIYKFQNTTQLPLEFQKR